MPASDVEDLRVDLARIGLAGDGVAGVEAHLLGDELVEPSDLGVIAVKEFEEAGLRAGRAFDAAGLERGDAVLELVQIQHQVVGPQAGPLADGRRLGRLQVREAEAGQVAVLLRRTWPARRSRRPAGRATQLQRLAHQDQVGVVGDVAARRAEVDDRPGRGADVAVGVDVGHHVVPQLPLVASAAAKSMSSTCRRELVDLLRRDRQAHSASASARATHSRRQVLNFRWAPHSAAISAEA